jgi:predicted flap endonuclease-1-like 5' DNA nuclease
MKDMNEVENKGVPWLGGWLIAAGAGVVVGGALLAVGKFDYTPAIAVGVVVFLLVGIILSWLGAPSAGMAPKPAAMPVVKPAPAPVMAAPAPAAKAAPAMAAPVAAPKAAPAMTPVMAAPAASGMAKKPEALKAARGGKADDLKIVKGIGPKLEILCHKLGFFHFDQVANWTADEVAWVDDNLEGFKGRVTRDRWVPQAKAIVSLGPDEFLRQLDAGKEF